MSQEWQAALQAVLSANGLGFWKRNLTNNQIDCNSECQRILGYDIEEIAHQDKFWNRLVHPKDQPRANKILQDYLENRIPIYKVKLRMLTKSGEWKWILESGQVYERDQTGKPLLLAGTYKDITKEVSANFAKKQQAQREELLRELQTKIIAGTSLETILEFAVEQLQNFLQVDRTMIYRSQADGSSSVVFESSAENLSSLKGHNLPMTIPTYLEGEFSTDKQQIFQRCTDTHHGERSYTELLVPIVVPSNQALSLNSHQKQFAISPLGIAEGIAQTGTVSLTQTDYSSGEYPSPQQIFNYSWGMLAVQQYDYCDKWKEWEIDTLKQLTRLIAIAIRQQERIAQAQRETVARKSIEAKLRSQSQKLQTTLDELSSLQEQLLENQKMSNLGQLTIDMVSEINKPANFIHKSLESASQYAQDLIDFLEDYQNNSTQAQRFSTSKIKYFDLEAVTTEFHNLLWSMGAGSERIKDIVDAMLLFANSNSEEVEEVDVHQVINSALKLLQYRLKEQPVRSGIQVIKEFGNLPLVQGHRGELTQVVVNILANAIDALEERMEQDYSFIPTIWIDTKFTSNHLCLVDKDKSQISVAKPLRNNKVILKIADNGKGILPHIQRQIFEPLFTTKAASTVKGLGLSICQKIVVEKHKGKLKCNSRFGEGSEFVIEISAKSPNLSYAREHSNFF